MAHTHPLLEMFFPRRTATQAVGDQIASLSHEVAKLAHQVRRQTAPRLQGAAHGLQDVAHDAGDFASDVFEHMKPVARDIAHRAQAAGRVVRDDPVPMVIALGTAALIATLLLRRR